MRLRERRGGNNRGGGGRGARDRKPRLLSAVAAP
uniref:Uncharacterized protein n=1 Tax=Arundo donax TaxID=35708 RepID=A0A0A9C4A8_ARUDO